MKKRILLLSLSVILLNLSQLTAQKTEVNNKLNCNSNYEIKAVFLPEEKLIKGEMVLNWKNISKDTIKDLQFHTFYNAFKNNKSTYLKQNSNTPFSGFEIPKIKSWNKIDQIAWMKRIGLNTSTRQDDWGWIEIKSMILDNKNEVVERLAYIHPDDGNKNDETVMRVRLEQSIVPGQTISIKIKFETKIPRILDRSGYSGDFYLIGQWFPKIGVWEAAGSRFATKGKWNCHQYHENSGFYSDFGDYQVSLNVPSDYTVGASGDLVSDSKKRDGIKELVYKANNVSDFAWTASLRIKEEIAQFHQVKIVALMQPEHQKQAGRIITAAKAAIEFLEDHIGTFPFSTITIVDPPFSAMANFSKATQGISGAAFPGIIAIGTLAHMPKALYIPEMVTTHELTMSFLSAIGVNGVEEAWMDEGLGSYLESRIMTKVLGFKTSFINYLGTKIGNFDAQRSTYVYAENQKLADLGRNAWKYSTFEFAKNSKSTIWFTTLERLLGENTMDDILKTYFTQWSGLHPNAENFIELANNVYKKQKNKIIGENLNWFFDQMIDGTNICDYKLANIKNIVEPKEQGFFEKKGQNSFVESDEIIEEDSVTSKFHSSVLVQRIGEVVMPLEILVRFENGDTAKVNWDGRARTHEFTFNKEFKIIWAKIDPDQKIQIDVNLTNNSMTLEPEKSAIWKVFFKFLFWIQNMIQLLAGIL